MKVYISGPMSGYPEHNFPAFYAEAQRLRSMGYEVINPAEIDQPVKEWGACMRNDIKALMDADAISLLPGWESSRGAQLEFTLGAALGMIAMESHNFVHVEEVTS